MIKIKTKKVKEENGRETKKNESKNKKGNERTQKKEI
jgi:hypothetical protein